MPTKLETLQISGFRGVSSLALSSLTRINVLVGPNGVGKSSILEAAVVAAEFRQTELFDALTYAIRRRGELSGGLRSLAKDGTKFSLRTRMTIDDTPREIAHSYEIVDRSSLHIQYPTLHGADTTVSYYHRGGNSTREYVGKYCQYVGHDVGAQDDIEEALSRSEAVGRRSKVVDLLRPILPELLDLRILMNKHKPQVFVEERVGNAGSRLWPLIGSGDGFRRLALLAARLAPAYGSVISIEDPETFQHQASLRQVAKLLWDVSSENQVFLSTHSLDLLHALLARVNGEPEASQIAVYVVTKHGDEATVERLSGSQAQAKRRARQLRQVLGHLDLDTDEG